MSPLEPTLLHLLKLPSDISNTLNTEYEYDYECQQHPDFLIAGN